ncbi:MAG: hypothetical protein AAB617_02070 [Patescibacteria group bacterium]
MYTILTLLLLVVALWILVAGWRDITNNTIAAAYLCGRYWTALEQGWQWWWPWPFGRHEEYSRKPIPISDTVKVNTKESDGDKPGGSNKVTLDYSFTFQPDFNLLGTYRRWDVETIVADLKAEIRSQLSILGGKHSYADFIKSHRAIETIIDCLLRLDVLPHYDPKSFGLTGVDVVPPDKRIAFYDEHHHEINLRLKSEVDRPGRISRFEEKYGIDIGGFHLDPAAFSPELTAALELERGTKQKLAAVDAVTSKIDEVTKKLPKLPIQEAADLVQATLGVPTKIIKVRSGGAVDVWLTPDAEKV